MPRLPNADKIRAQTLYKLGKSILQLSRSFNVDRKTIRKWVNRRQNQVSDKKRSGRPVKVTLRTVRQ